MPLQNQWLWLLNIDIDALVDAALALIFADAQMTDLARVSDMRATIRLQIQPDNFNGAHFGNARRQQVDLGANQIRNLKGLFTREALDTNVTLCRHFRIDLGFDLVDQFFLQAF